MEAGEEENGRLVASANMGAVGLEKEEQQGSKDTEMLVTWVLVFGEQPEAQGASKLLSLWGSTHTTQVYTGCFQVIRHGPQHHTRPPLFPGPPPTLPQLSYDRFFSRTNRGYCRRSQHTYNQHLLPG